MEEITFTVGIVGLGLIGGSMAKAYRAAGHRVLAAETNRKIFDFAVLSGVVAGELNDDTVSECALILIAVYPRAAIRYLEEKGQTIPPRAVVIDCCGTKRGVCAAGFQAAKAYGFTFVGGHPMAGTERSGFKYSKATMFKGASMVLVPPVYDDIRLLERVKRLLAPAGFDSLTVTTAERHDEMIAFTSQMAHLVSNAFIKSPTARSHSGFSAGSYKDLTRVAWLDEKLWTELFLENRANLLRELDGFLVNMADYRDALAAEDGETMRALLREGKEIKEEVDR
ncbi:MAG: prephenate dehydrogenase [Firmicutes bacterium]|nr:prephenate dehydrogenase [Bacillota bacterium]